MPVINWKLDKYFLKRDSSSRDGKERIHSREYPLAIDGVVDKVFRKTPRFLLGAIQEETA